MQLIIPSRFILPNETLSLVEEDQLKVIFDDKSIWQWWSGGDGSKTFRDRINSSQQDINYFYTDKDRNIILWIGREEEILSIQICVVPPNNRRYGALAIDCIVQSLWSFNWRKIETQAALNETNLLITYHRAYFLSDEEFIIDDTIISDEVAKLVRYSPEVIYS